MYSTNPGLLQKMTKKCNSQGIFPSLVVFLGVFFRKFAKKAKCNSQGVSTVRYRFEVVLGCSRYFGSKIVSWYFHNFKVNLYIYIFAIIFQKQSTDYYIPNFQNHP